MEALKLSLSTLGQRESRHTMNLPQAVLDAQALDWGVLVDAFLVNAARVGEVYAATVFCDRSRTIPDGSTVVTPPVRLLAVREPYRLLQTLDAGDHYVVASYFSGEEPVHG
ncbi:hypothetical protein V2K16_14395 [Pseudomonas alliivorans]|uniref:hypothetical protein n=1 Tax=Pseudomonas alliivorans TaxID=2810613 RepID=UPI001AEB1C37|nr:hypothetical protein [Pseudomonas alliivorans]MBP0941015.1 hypothetical protein [Pseudomonas alliivorans]MEE4879985.1 hypothetical protein [Pseudomonas alliivorans]MEE4930867.1 hypothetical protein [Pseudomonas alliivorans]MEE4936141.1 hypothetical protein [Pseudomonas alliivorans]MEE4940707.1 hypothetical protein [Pseudomonas alliivorans]